MCQVPQKKGTIDLPSMIRHMAHIKTRTEGNRAKVISELRETQRKSQAETRKNEDEAIASKAFNKAPELLSNRLVSQCVDFFLSNMYGTMPVLQRSTLADITSRVDNDLEAYCLMASFCGYVLTQPNIDIKPEAPSEPGSSARSTTQLGLCFAEGGHRGQEIYGLCRVAFTVLL